MATIFALLLLISIGLFGWGLIAPHTLSRFANKSMSRKEAALVFGGAVFIFFILTGVTVPKTSTTTKQPPANPPAKITNTPSTEKSVPLVTTKTVTETQPIPHDSKTVDDPSLAQGTNKTTTKGVDGTKTLTYEITYSDGQQTDKKLIKSETTTAMVTEVISHGTKTPVAAAPAQSSSNCDPNYSGACVPNVYPSDVDCAGGSGNGPYYVRGPVYVVGTDHYRLDGDGDHVACEK